jgi:hypothetical protein
MGRNNYWDEEAVAVDGAGLRCHVAWSVLLCCVTVSSQVITWGSRAMSWCR